MLVKKCVKLILLSTVLSLYSAAGSCLANNSLNETQPVVKNAQAQSQRLIALQHINITGNQRVDAKTIIRYTELEQGSSVTIKDINEAIKRLYMTGFFTEVTARKQDDGVLFRVAENPMVNNVKFQGNKELEEEKLVAELSLKPRGLYTKPKLQADVERLQNIYRRSGRFSAKITPKLQTLEQNRVDVTFAVEEGEVTKIGKIDFIGNERFDDATLLEVVNSETECWFCFLAENDKYDPDKVMYDKELLRRFYTKQGYADFAVKSITTELSPKRDKFFITFTIDEGKRYRIGKINIESSLPDAANKTLRKTIEISKGDYFNSEAIENTVDSLVEELGDRGFAFVDIDPQINRIDQKTIDLTFKIAEGPRVYVERIDIEGNVRTLDEVIRREFRLSEGDAYSTSKMQRSEQRLRNLGFFEDVKIKTKQGSSPDRVIVDVGVAEQSTGEVSLGGGFSTVDGVLADIGLRERNLLGRGQELRAKGTFAQFRQQYDIGFTEPYFLGRDIAAGFDLFNTLQNFRTQTAFDRATTGGRLRFGYALTESLRQDLYYSYQETDIQNIRAGASRFIRDQVGSNATSLVGQSLTYNKLDNNINPTDGYNVRFALDFAGLGGNSEFVRPDVRGQFFYSIAPDWIFMQSASGGYVHALNEGIRIQDRYFIGQREMRGFDLIGIGPRDRTTGDALGGNVYYTTTTELLFPLGLPNELGIKGAAFLDTGTLYQIDQSGVDVLDDSAIRVSAGLGVAWNSPFGLLRLDYGQAIVKQDYDVEENFRFSFGGRF
jgi:outer membrane protein insertion porin family